MTLDCLIRLGKDNRKDCLNWPYLDGVMKIIHLLVKETN